jgi:hypothetical protein
MHRGQHLLHPFTSLPRRETLTCEFRLFLFRPLLIFDTHFGFDELYLKEEGWRERGGAEPGGLYRDGEIRLGDNYSSAISVQDQPWNGQEKTYHGPEEGWKCLEVNKRHA